MANESSHQMTEDNAAQGWGQIYCVANPEHIHEPTTDLSLKPKGRDVCRFCRYEIAALQRPSREAELLEVLDDAFWGFVWAQTEYGQMGRERFGKGLDAYVDEFRKWRLPEEEMERNLARAVAIESREAALVEALRKTLEQADCTISELQATVQLVTNMAKSGTKPMSDPMQWDGPSLGRRWFEVDRMKAKALISGLSEGG